MLVFNIVQQPVVRTRSIIESTKVYKIYDLFAPEPTTVPIIYLTPQPILLHPTTESLCSDPINAAHFLQLEMENKNRISRPAATTTTTRSP